MTVQPRRGEALLRDPSRLESCIARSVNLQPLRTAKRR